MTNRAAWFSLAVQLSTCSWWSLWNISNNASVSGNFYRIMKYKETPPKNISVMPIREETRCIKRSIEYFGKVTIFINTLFRIHSSRLYRNVSKVSLQRIDAKWCEKACRSVRYRCCVFLEIIIKTYWIFGRDSILALDPKNAHSQIVFVRSFENNGPTTIRNKVGHWNTHVATVVSYGIF